MKTNYAPPATWEDHLRERAATAILAGFGATSSVCIDGTHMVQCNRFGLAVEALARADALIEALANRTTNLGNPA